MANQKSRFLGIILALFTGPFSFLYVKKWKKTLVFFPLIFVPWLNIIVYFIMLFSITKDVKKYNSQKMDELRYGLIACKCGNQNRSGSLYCTACGKPITYVCVSCQTHIPKGQSYCNLCGTGLKEQLRKLYLIKNIKLTAAITIIALLLISLIH